jgi:hypothetical protein
MPDDVWLEVSVLEAEYLTGAAKTGLKFPRHFEQKLIG